MLEVKPGTNEPLRVLEAHLTAMSEAAAAIEIMLGRWAQLWCETTVEEAVSSDPHRTKLLESADTYGQLMDEVGRLSAALPARIAAGLRATVWRHQFVNVERDGSGYVMGDLDFGTWQETGHKLPPAYEPVISKELGRVNQVLRKYGYRPDFVPVGAKRRFPAPPQAIPTMETYYRLAMRLPEIVAAAEKAHRQAAHDAAVASWH
jgi:hypothetical protein